MDRFCRRCDVRDVTQPFTPSSYVTHRHDIVNSPPPSAREVIYGRPLIGRMHFYNQLKILHNWPNALIISLPCPMNERRRLHELSTDNLFCSPPVDQASVAPLNDIIDPLFLLTFCRRFPGMMPSMMSFSKLSCLVV